MNWFDSSSSTLTGHLVLPCTAVWLCEHPRRRSDSNVLSSLCPPRARPFSPSPLSPLLVPCHITSCHVVSTQLLLNVCECEPPEEQEGAALEEEGYDEQEDQEAAELAEASGDEDEDDSSDREVSDDGEKSASDPTANLPPSPASSATATAGAGLTVIVPGRAALLREQGLLDAAWGSSVTARAEKGVCGCVAVLDDKGALEFNSEDVAALLTLALGRVHPFMPLAARITAAAEEAGWDGGAGEEDDDDDGDEETLDARVWAAVQQYTLECRAAAAAAAIAGTPASAHLFSSPGSSGSMPPPPPTTTTRSARKMGRPAAVDDAASPGAGSSSAEEGEDGEVEAAAVAGEAAASAAVPASPTVTAGVPEGDDPTAAAEEEVAEVELTVDEAADLLEFVAAARFIAQLIAEPVVAAGVSAGRWSCAMRLAGQVRKLAEEEQQAQQIASTATAAPTLSLSNMLCLGALADVQGLGLIMAQQARYAPALEAVLKRELRQALRRGQGLKRRIRHRLQPGAPYVFAFPMVMPACQLVHHG